MSKQLVERIRKAREFRIEVNKPAEGQWVFLASRPTDLDMVELMRLQGGEQFRYGMRFVHGWENVTEDDIVGGACMDAVKFDRTLWEAFVEDRSDLWPAITDAIFAEFEKAKGRAKEAEKN